MSTVTLDGVLTDAGRLPIEEQQILEELLRKRRIEAWRAETAAEGRKSAAASRSGKLILQSAGAVISPLKEIE